MRIWNQQMKTETSIRKALALEDTPGLVISVVGGGGKTSLLFRLLLEYRQVGCTVLLTTTTNMYYDPEHPYADWHDTEGVREQIDRYGYVMAGEEIFPADEGSRSSKIKGLPADQVGKLRELADIILVEADGSRHLPIKVPAKWEPALYADSDYVIGVMGMEAAGMSLSEACHRPQLAADFLEKKLSDRITIGDMKKLAVSEQALRKHVKKQYRVFLNQVDSQKQLPQAEAVLQMLEKESIVAAAGCTKDVAVVMLAAGNSSRFGENKLRYPVDGLPMYQHIVKKCLNLPVFRWIMVTQYPEIEEELAGSPVELVRNNHPGWGISHSIQLGIEAARDADAYLFTVCDQPYMSEHTLENLLAEFRRERYGLAAVCYEDHWGNPNIFSAAYRDALMSLQGDVGGKKILMAHMHDLLKVSVEDKKELKDLDKKEEVL